MKEQTGKQGYAASLLKSVTLDVAEIDTALNCFEDKLNNPENRLETSEEKISELEKNIKRNQR